MVGCSSVSQPQVLPPASGEAPTASPSASPSVEATSEGRPLSPRQQAEADAKAALEHYFQTANATAQEMPVKAFDVSSRTLLRCLRCRRTDFARRHPERA